jgi:cell division control protein 6
LDGGWLGHSLLPLRPPPLEVVAIGILRSTARQTQETDAEGISFQMIHESIPEAKTKIRQKNIDQLPPHQRALYEIVREHDSLKPLDLYKQYRSRVEDPRSDRTVRNYLSKLGHYNLIEKKGDGRGRIYCLPA